MSSSRGTGLVAGPGHVAESFRVSDHGQVRVGDDHNVNTYNFHMASLAPQLPRSPPPPSPSIIIPFRRDRDFVERPLLGDILQRTTELGARIGLVGLGGVGKSQIAIEYAYRVRETHPDTWVFWVHASSAARFEESYRKIAARLRLPGWNEPKADVLGVVHGWLSNEINGRWTMVVDNADDAMVMFEPWNGETSTTTAATSAGPSPSDFLPLSSYGSIVITSRSQEVLERLQVFGEDLLAVEPMEVDMATTLLLRKLRKTGQEASSDELTRLITQLDCMPLAITQAAAYIEHSAPRITVSKYTEKLEKNDGEHTALLQKDIRDPRRDQQASNSIIMTWHVTFTHLRQARASAAQLLALMSLFDREAIPDYLLQGLYFDVPDGQTDFEDDIVTLRAYSLIGIGLSNGTFDMHRLVQLSTQKWLEVHAELQVWQGLYIMIMDAGFPVGNYPNWTTCQALFPHVEAMQRYQETDTDRLQIWANVLYKGAWYARERGQHRTADVMARASLEARRAALGADDAQTLSSMEMLVSVLQHQGKYEEAEEMTRQVLAGREKLLGVDNPSTLTSRGILALVLQLQGKYKQAEEINRQALTGYEKALDVDHPDTFTSRSNLALVLQLQRKYKQAEEIIRQVLAGREKALGEDHLDTLMSVSCLARLLSALHDYHEALGLYLRACIGYNKVLGPEHPDTVDCHRRMALLLKKMKLSNGTTARQVHVESNSGNVGTCNS